MIQRKQTLYMLGALISLGLMFLPLVKFLTPIETFEFKPFGLYGSEELFIRTLPLFCLVTGVMALLFATIFLYKRRMLQVRICGFLSVCTLGIAAFVGYYVWRFSAVMEEMSVLGVKYSVSLVMPILAFIFLIMAFKAILKDELLIKSLNRLR